MIDPRPKSDGHEARPKENRYHGTGMPLATDMEVASVKSVLLLTIALFLISAPAPDSSDIAEMTANFIVPKQEPGLQASQQIESREALSRSVDEPSRNSDAAPVARSAQADTLPGQQERKRLEPPSET